MAKPRLIIVIRHAQSEGNKNREIHQSIPDHRVKLTQLGWQQARDAGRRLRSMLRPDDTLQFYTSPYRRTRETTDGILESLTGQDPDSGDASPFAREQIKVYEEPRLREQDFGNFQPCSTEMERMWQERADYGHFFYRIPNGESAADAYDRVSGFNESLWRQFGDEDFPSVCVLVTHGLMSRVFLMKWYHFTVEYFEDLRNVNHCEFLIMRKQDETGKFLLETKLRTWSELRRERAEREKEKDPKEAVAKLERTKTFVVTRRWGGCPNGCNHGTHYKRRDDLEALRQRDMHGTNGANGTNGASGANGTNGIHGASTHSTHSSPAIGSGSFTAGSPHLSSTSGTIASRRLLQRQQSYISDDDYAGDGAAGSDNPDAAPQVMIAGPQIDVDRAMDDMVSSPDGTPSFISPENRVLKSPQFFKVGRDGGGSHSGVQSLANSDAELSDEDLKVRRRIVSMDRAQRNGGVSLNGAVTRSFKMQNMAAALDDSSDKEVMTTTTTRAARANRLGDGGSSDLGSDGDGDAENEADDDLAKAEKEDRSIMGSVY